MFKSSCGKCNGSGTIQGFSHVLGGVCFTCEGRGFLEVRTDPAVLAKRREAARAKSAEAREARAQAARAAADERECRYSADPRIGPETRARMDQFPAVAYEVYKALDDLDRGANPWVLASVAA